MSHHTPEENLRLVRLPEKFVKHWIIETLRLYLLCEVLFRSLRYEDTVCPSTGGDDELVIHIKSSLNALFTEIEEVNDGHWEPRSWEVEDG